MSSNESRISNPISIAIACFLAIALYNVIELIILIIVTFRKRNGLYFWSFIIATLGIAVHDIGWLFKNFGVITNSYLYITILTIGWYAMVTGQSFVLYSRLHIVICNQNWLRAVLATIVTNGIICHIPTTVMTYGANSDNPMPYLGIYAIYERIQVTLFFIQEIMISVLYIYQTTELIKNRATRSRNSNHKLMRRLLGCNVLVIILDVTILVLEFCNLYSVQTSYKGFSYSIKLKLEFSILNDLVKEFQPRNNTSSFRYTVGRDGVTQLGSVGSHKVNGQSTRDKMHRGYTAHISAGGAEELEITPDLGTAKKSVLRTTEILISTNWKSIPWQGAASSTHSDLNGESPTPTGGDDAEDMRPSSSRKEFASAGF